MFEALHGGVPNQALVARRTQIFLDRRAEAEDLGEVVPSCLQGVRALPLVAALKQIDPKHTVHFVAYALEEFYDSYYEEHFYDEGFYDVYHYGELSLLGSSRYVGDAIR